MNSFSDSFSDKVFAAIKHEMKLFIGVILGFLIFLGFSLSPWNVLIFLMLAVFIETTLIFSSFFNRQIKMTIPQAIKQANAGKRGRPKGSKNKSKTEQPKINEGVIHL